MLAAAAAGQWADGCTAIAVWVFAPSGLLFVASLGDARAVLARCEAPGAPPRAVVLSREHKPIHPAERARIERAGGSVVDGRLDGRLEVSRAFGDRQFKKHGLSAAPDVVVATLGPPDRFLLLGE